MKLVASIIICQLAGIVGSFFTASSVPIWYEGLNKPSFSPPNWIFGPVWIFLYLLMGISLYLVWSKKMNKRIKNALTIFGIQLVLNSLWSIIFFGLRLPLAAYIEILILLVFIILTISRFWKISKVSAILLVPYLLWVSFASILNFHIFKLN